ncbi:hypothetical protein ACIRU3_30420 [Streptomyces sp. NPDC101151]|uniref:hypothetical protein n=1 Tax=Streptomyces sp. NPDC101151 TaxID=3366115 RepID=UPI0037F4B3D6
MKNKLMTSASFVATLMLAMLTAVIPSSTAHAEAGGRWYFVNQYNHQCIKGNGEGKKLSLAPCKKKDAFHWNNYGATAYVNYSLDMYPFGGICINSKGRGKTPTLDGCETGRDTTGWVTTDLHNNHKTLLTHINCGYVQAVSKTKVVCTKRPANRKKMFWIVKYSLR